MTPLEGFLRHKIAEEGPLTVRDFMALVLHHPEYGYYRHQKPLGRQGDFITAPEVSSLFGEVIGSVLLSKALSLHDDTPLHLIELGPGRGVLLKDILRVFHLRPDILARLQVHLVDLNEPYRDTLKAAAAPFKSHFYQSYQELRANLPQGALLLVANEFLDALPVVQYQMTNEGWAERAVGVDQQNKLFFTTTPCDVHRQHVSQASLNTIYEVCSEAEMITDQIARDLKQRDGLALIIDYGYERPAFGDTLQALYRHQYVSPLSHLGEADLTCHVNFAALIMNAKAVECDTIMMTQRDFLLSFGVDHRLRRLLHTAAAQKNSDLLRSYHRLIDANQMGSLFKVMMMGELK